MRNKTIFCSACALVMILLLSACGGVNFSPEDAAVEMLLQETTVGMVVDRGTLETLQTIEMDERQVIVMLHFQGTRPNMGPVACLYTYQVKRQVVGWRAANGGGACRQVQPDRPAQDIEVFTGTFSGQNPQDPGYTLVYGAVENPQIEQVVLLWEDGQQTDLEVVRGSLLFYRNGDGKVSEVRGLDDQGQVVYSVFLNPPAP